jgi:tetratricopeptide (TPR) repeat protein
VNATNFEDCEASFKLAVALTRTDRLEPALKEVQRVRQLAGQQGGAAIFEMIISSYEVSLRAHPDDKEALYGLAWAYYEKAYMLARAYYKNPPSRTFRCGVEVPTAIEKVLRQRQVVRCYELSVKVFGEILQRTPDDVYAAVYRTHVKAEYTRNYEEAASSLGAIRFKHPDSPLPSIFLEQLELRTHVQRKYGPEELISINETWRYSSEKRICTPK